MAMKMIFLVLFLVFCSNLVNGDTIADDCSPQVTKVSTCLSFATGKSDTPTKECCTSVTELKKDDPECLCFFMQQAHNGSSALKSMGLQQDKLLQLPSACKLVNASIAECPKLLNLPANSPDAAIFTNVTTPDTAPATTSPGGSSSSSTPMGSSDGYSNISQLSTTLVLAMLVIFIAFFA